MTRQCAVVVARTKNKRWPALSRECQKKKTGRSRENRTQTVRHRTTALVALGRRAQLDARRSAGRTLAANDFFSFLSYFFQGKRGPQCGKIARRAQLFIYCAMIPSLDDRLSERSASPRRHPSRRRRRARLVHDARIESGAVIKIDASFNGNSAASTLRRPCATRTIIATRNARHGVLFFLIQKIFQFFSFSSECWPLDRTVPLGATPFQASRGDGLAHIPPGRSHVCGFHLIQSL